MEADGVATKTADQALMQVIRALTGLDDETRRRVIESACVYIGVKVTFQPTPR